MLRLVIADDEKSTRDCVIECIDWEQHGMQIVGTASDGLEAKRLIEQERPDIAILDIQMPSISVLSVTAVIQSSSATLGILQALSITGQLTFGSIYPLLIDICLGDCITTAIVCSIGAKADAKRTGIVHILFNLNEAVLLFAAVNLLHSAGAPTASGPRRSPPTANSSNLQAQAARPCPSRPPANPAAWIGPGRAFYRPASRCTV